MYIRCFNTQPTNSSAKDKLGTHRRFIMLISYVLGFLVIQAIAALEENQMDDDYEYEYDDGEDDDSDEEYDDDYYDYEGDIEDFDYDALKDIEKKLKSINLDPKPVPTLSPEEMVEYQRMKNLRASLDGLVDKDSIKTENEDDEEIKKIKDEFFTFTNRKTEL